MITLSKSFKTSSQVRLQRGYYLFSTYNQLLSQHTYKTSLDLFLHPPVIMKSHFPFVRVKEKQRYKRVEKQTVLDFLFMNFSSASLFLELESGGMYDFYLSNHLT